jgi:Bacterial DNA-binding protein
MEEWQSSRSWCKAANCLSAGRIGRNPRSGVKVGVRDKSVPVFRPSKEMGRRLNPVGFDTRIIRMDFSAQRIRAPSGNPLFPVWREHWLRLRRGGRQRSPKRIRLFLLRRRQ